MQRARTRRKARQWAMIAVVVLALILAPFFLFGEDVNGWAERWTSPELRAGAIGAAVVLLLALDVLLPVPSSIVSTAAGASLGFLPGFAASLAGMTLGSLFAYALGRKYGLPLVRRGVGDRDLEDVAMRFRSGAGWALAAMRPIPVLAEASALFAGVSRVPFPTYAAVTTLANAGISAVYCAFGAGAMNGRSFLLACAASLALPGIAMALNRLWRTGRG
jgi:uncharacterized membrane protein YdjX (TVP38/TMEM64 family)